MKTSELACLTPFEPLVVSEDKEIQSVYCADLLSWAMSRAPEDSAWCTVMGNINAVAVASMTDVAAIILCEGAALADDAAQKAQEQGVNIYKTGLPAFEAGQTIARAAGLNG